MQQSEGYVGAGCGERVCHRRYARKGERVCVRALRCAEGIVCIPSVCARWREMVDENT